MKLRTLDHAGVPMPRKLKLTLPPLDDAAYVEPPPATCPVCEEVRPGWHFRQTPGAARSPICFSCGSSRASHRYSLPSGNWADNLIVQDAAAVIRAIEEEAARVRRA